MLWIGDVKLTVVIPLYNKKATIRRAIESVLLQLGDDDALLVIDDGSTDGSSDVAGELYDSRLRVLPQANQGVSVARNRGVEAARTEHVAFLDADDWWMPGVVNRFKQMIRECNDCAMYTVGHMRCGPGEVVGVRKGIRAERFEVLNGVDFIRRYSREQLINSSTSCVKKEYLERIDGFPAEAKSGEDIYVWLRIALLGCNISVCHEQLAVIEREPPGSGKLRDPVPYHIRWFSKRSILQKLDNNQRSAVSRFLFRRAMNLSAGEVMAGRRFNAFRISLTCARINIFFIVPGLLVVAFPKLVFRKLYEFKHHKRAE
jgi:glycosyltransferase involved in cell wall biosynthesis